MTRAPLILRLTVGLATILVACLAFGQQASHLTPVDPLWIQAFIELSPLLQKLNETPTPDDEPYNDMVYSFEKLLAIKPWYFSTEALNTIDANTLGLNHLADATEQEAIQYPDRLLIDLRKWQEKDLQEQKILLLHEVLMQLYLSQFQELTDICKAARPLGIACSPSRYNSIFMKHVYAAVPARPLVAEDYKNIRYATNWMLSHGAKASRELIRKMLLAKGFDRRFLRVLRNSDTKNKTLYESEKITVEEFDYVAQTSMLLGKMPDQCYGLYTKTAFACEVAITPLNVSESKGHFQFSIVSKNKALGVHHSFEFVINTGVVSRLKQRDNSYYSLLAETKSKTCNAGEDLAQISFDIFHPVEGAGDEIRSAAFRPLRSLGPDKSGITKAELPSVTNLRNDVILLYRTEYPLAFYWNTFGETYNQKFTQQNSRCKSKRDR